MKFASLLVTVGVYAAKIWMEFYSTKVAPRCRKSVWQCCSSVKCGTMWFIVLFVAGLFVTGVLVAVALFSKAEQKASQVTTTSGEVYYDMAYVVILIFVLPIFFLFIPCLVLYHIHRPTYNYLATPDPPPPEIKELI